MMPPRAIFALLALKSDLLARQASESTTQPAMREAKRKPAQRMRHARTKTTGFQRMCQRREWAGPVW